MTRMNILANAITVEQCEEIVNGASLAEIDTTKIELSDKVSISIPEDFEVVSLDTNEIAAYQDINTLVCKSTDVDMSVTIDEYPMYTTLEKKLEDINELIEEFGGNITQQSINGVELYKTIIASKSFFECYVTFEVDERVYSINALVAEGENPDDIFNYIINNMLEIK